ncbi:MAG TPA: hypothetical protein VF944_02490 [Candidatus Bathyarchaeia archaeon]
MTIPFVGGDVGEDLGKLASAIGNLIQPNAQFNQQAKLLFLQKPELMQKMVDVEKANPGTLKAFGFNERATDLLSGMQESIAGMKERVLQPGTEEALTKPGAARREAVSREATGLTEGQVATDTLAKWMSTGGVDLLQKDPVAFQRAVREKLGLPTGIKAAEETAQLAAFKRGATLKNETPTSLADKVVAGTISIADLSGGVVNPETEAGTKFALHMIAQNKEEEMRMRLLRAGKKLDDWQARARFGVASDLTRLSGGSVPFSAFYQKLWGEQYEGGPPPSDEDMKQAEQFLKDTGADKGIQRKQRLWRTISPVLDAVNNPKKDVKVRPENAQKAAADINAALKESGDTTWTAVAQGPGWAWELPPYHKTRILFQDKQGNITPDPSVLLSSTPNPFTQDGRAVADSQLTPVMRQKGAWLNSLSDDAKEAEATRMYTAERARGGDGSTTTRTLQGAGLTDYIEAQGPDSTSEEEE